VISTFDGDVLRVRDDRLDDAVSILLAVRHSLAT
jgi:hypothetical protein